VSAFNLENQNSHVDQKIVAGLERLSQVFRILLWEKAKEQGLSPIQIQLLIFIRYHSPEKSTVSYLAQEFNLTKPTISDAVKVLEQKKLIEKCPDTADTRSYTIQLTETGKKIVLETEDFPAPLGQLVSGLGEADKSTLWLTLISLIGQLNRLKIISVQRMCFNCRHYVATDATHFCNLLNLPLLVEELRMDCPEFEQHM
jgi:DNA-binding MarR family transcriptional regulator